MRYLVLIILACCIVSLLLTAGCADVNVQKKVGDFGTAFGASPEEQQAINWFKTTYGDPTTNNDQPARFVEPLVTSGISEKKLPVDKVTMFPASGGSVYFFVIYDNFKKDDPITVTWTYLENARVVSTVEQQAGGDFGRFIVEFQKPDSGWGKGRQEIAVTGDGATAKVNFTIGDTLQTTPLPYNPSAATSAQPTGTVTQPATTPTTAVTSQQTTSGTTCPQGQTSCSGRCVDLTIDYTNCGACGRACPSGQLCINGACIVTCQQGETNCNGRCVDLNNDRSNCGRCGAACSFPNSLGACQAGTCSIGVCNMGWADCDQNQANGCETNIMASSNNCGRCGQVCQPQQHCSQGTCIK